MKYRITKNSLLIFFAVTFLNPLLFFSCTDPETSKKDNLQKEIKSEAVPEIYKKPPSSFSDTIIIKGKSAIFFNPDSLQLEKIKNIIPEITYENNIHDCFYQMRNARMVLKKYWPQIHIIEISKARYLLFMKADKSTICIDLNTRNDQCGIFLFDTRKNPLLVDMMNIDTALGFYFEK